MTERADGPPLVGAGDRRILSRLARATLEAGRDTGEAARLAAGSATLGAPGAAFVTLSRRVSGELRGCCGHVVPRTSLAQSVASMTLASAREDPRFPPVAADEVNGLSIEITAMGPLRPLDLDALVIGRHGLMIHVGGRRGLLLPQVAIDQGWDREAFLDGLCRKAGLPAGSWRRPDAVLEAFEAVHWGEDEDPEA